MGKKKALRAVPLKKKKVKKKGKKGKKDFTISVKTKKKKKKVVSKTKVPPSVGAYFAKTKRTNLEESMENYIKKENGMEKNVEGLDANTLLVGIDFGTSRSVLVSPQGDRFVCPTAVGWPKDMIGIKFFGKSVIVGEEAINNRDALQLCFPLREGVIDESEPRAVEATEELLRYLLDQVKDKDYEKIYGIFGVPARASIHSQQFLAKIAGKLMDAARIVSEPFVVAYNEAKLSRSIIIDIGAGTVDVCGTKGTIPGEDDQVTLNKAGDYVDNQLLKALKEKYPDIQINIFVAKNIKEKFGFIGKSTDKAVWEFRANGKPVHYDVSDEIERACRSILPEIVEAVQSITATFDPEFQRSVLDNIILAGGMSQIRGLGKAIEKELQDILGGAKVSIASDPLYAGVDGALKLLLDIPPKFYPKLDSVTL